MAQILPFLPRRAARLNRVFKGRLLTRRALAAELQISTRTLQRYEKKGLPAARRGFVSLYDPDLVYPWLAANSWVPVPPERLAHLAGTPAPDGDAA